MENEILKEVHKLTILDKVLFYFDDDKSFSLDVSDRHIVNHYLKNKSLIKNSYDQIKHKLLAKFKDIRTLDKLVRILCYNYNQYVNGIGKEILRKAKGFENFESNDEMIIKIGYFMVNIRSIEEDFDILAFNKKLMELN